MAAVVGAWYDIARMRQNRWTIVALVLALVAVAAYWLSTRHSPAPPVVDLIQLFPTSETRSSEPREKVFHVLDLKIGDEQKRAIEVPAPSRIYFKVRVPEDGWLRTSLALKPEAWDKEGDGVLFRIGMWDGKIYDELLNQVVNPYSVPGDRRWLSVVLDLSAYGGEEMDVLFNTNPSPPRKPEDRRNDLAVWGAPEIYVK